MCDQRTAAKFNPRRQTTTRSAGFTLVELLVVIGIIVVLIGILVPTVTKVRQRGYLATTATQIQALSGSIQQYHDVFAAYPGPLDDNDGAIIRSSAAANTGNRFTTSELLVMSLCGGLQFNTVVGNAVTVKFVFQDVGKGPMSLGDPSVKMPKRYEPFIDPKVGGIDPLGSSATGWKAWNNAAHAEVPYRTIFGDSAAPEFVDRFPDALPILYIRAKPGATGTVGRGGTPPTPGWAPPGVPFAYDVDVLWPYQRFPTRPLGTGNAMFPSYALEGQSTNPPKKYDYGTFKDHNLADIAYYFAEPVDQAKVPVSGLSARQKGGYMLISAGLDRVYGTVDDVTNAGPVLP